MWIIFLLGLIVLYTTIQFLDFYMDKAEDKKIRIMMQELKMKRDLTQKIKGKLYMNNVHMIWGKLPDKVRNPVSSKASLDIHINSVNLRNTVSDTIKHQINTRYDQQ